MEVLVLSVGWLMSRVIPINIAQSQFTNIYIPERRSVVGGLFEERM